MLKVDEVDGRRTGDEANRDDWSSLGDEMRWNAITTTSLTSPTTNVMNSPNTSPDTPCHHRNRWTTAPQQLGIERVQARTR